LIYKELHSTALLSIQGNLLQNSSPMNRNICWWAYRSNIEIERVWNITPLWNV